MKNLLTIVVCCDAGEKHASTLYDGIELIYPEDKETDADFLARAAKIAKGKYTVLLDKKFMFADVNSLLNILDKNPNDLISFTGGAAIKTSVVKGVAKDCTDCFSCFITSVMNCKTMLTSVYMPFTFIKPEINFSEANYSGMSIALEVFGEKKKELIKSLYSYTLSTFCHRLEQFYIFSILAVNNGELEAEKLISFDGKLKTETVLSLTLEKNFTAAKLSKLRKKNFKISWLTERKFKKALKTK